MRQLSTAGQTHVPIATPIDEVASSNTEIPHAIPEDPEEKKRIRRRYRLRWAAIWLVAGAIVGIVLGSAFGTNKSNGNGSTTEPEPSKEFLELKELVTSVSFDNGTSLDDTESPQYKALTWLEGNANLDTYPDWKRIQRYALGALYYSTGADEWTHNGGWLTDIDECDWYSQAEELETPLSVCTENGTYSAIIMEKNNMQGTIPLELVLLSNSLGTCNLLND